MSSSIYDREEMQNLAEMQVRHGTRERGALAGCVPTELSLWKQSAFSKSLWVNLIKPGLPRSPGADVLVLQQAQLCLMVFEAFLYSALTPDSDSPSFMVS